MKPAVKKQLDWADREAARLVQTLRIVDPSGNANTILADTLRRAAHNHLLFDVLNPPNKST